MMTNKETLEILKLCFSSIAIMVIVKSLTRVRLFATPWTIADQVPLSMGFSRQDYWSGLPFPSPGDLPNPGGANSITSRETKIPQASRGLARIEV